MLLFILASIGLTNLIIESSLLEPVRDWLKSVLPAKVLNRAVGYACRTQK